MSELKPCPFCDGYAISDYAEVPSLYTVYCGECGAITAMFGTEQDAIEAWNARAERTCKRFFVPSEGVMKCDNCMTNLNPSWWSFCPNCGAKVVE